MNIALGTVASATALTASSSLVPAMPTVPDPIFAAIERYKAAYVALGHVLDRLEEAETRGVKSEIDERHRLEHEACSADSNACAEMVATIPTTFAGVMALLRFVDEEHARGNKLLYDETFEVLISTTISALAQFEEPRQVLTSAVSGAAADADLITLEAKIMAAARDAEISGSAYNCAERVYFEWRRRNPQPEGASDDFARWDAERQATKVACHYEEAEAKWHAGCAELLHLTEEIAATAALTMDGIKIKRRIARYKSKLINLDGEDQFTITDSIKRDLRMQRKLAAA